MFSRAWLWGSLCFVLSGCASPPATTTAPWSAPWRDEVFAYDPALVKVHADTLFRLDEGLAAQLREPRLKNLRRPQRVEALLVFLFGAERRAFDYAPGHSTTAAETWRLKRGDCLSLTVLTYAVAKELELEAAMQEVDIPSIHDRHGNFDFVNQHVNVVITNGWKTVIDRGVAEPRDVIVDFEPAIGSFRKGFPLSEKSILARYYNNIAVESMAGRDERTAYAYFRAALEADPGYPAALANLAILYHARGLDAEAETFLRQALKLDRVPYVRRYWKARALLAQGRAAEAAQYAKQLQQVKENDPYYWIDRGLEMLATNQDRQAVRALEHAEELTTGFVEVHRYLAIAYLRTGDKARADQQLTRLAALDAADPMLPRLQAKTRPPKRATASQ